MNKRYDVTLLSPSGSYETFCSVELEDLIDLDKSITKLLIDVCAPWPREEWTVVSVADAAIEVAVDTIASSEETNNSQV